MLQQLSGSGVAGVGGRPHSALLTHGWCLEQCFYQLSLSLSPKLFYSYSYLAYSACSLLVQEFQTNWTWVVISVETISICLPLLPLQFLTGSRYQCILNGFIGDTSDLLYLKQQSVSPRLLGNIINSISAERMVHVLGNFTLFCGWLVSFPVPLSGVLCRASQRRT